MPRTHHAGSASCWYALGAMQVSQAVNVAGTRLPGNRRNTCCNYSESSVQMFSQVQSPLHSPACQVVAELPRCMHAFPHPKQGHKLCIMLTLKLQTYPERGRIRGTCTHLGQACQPGTRSAHGR